MEQYRIIPLTSNINISSFDCGIFDLNDFFQNEALKNQNDWLSLTMVMIGNDASLLGFYTLTPDTLHRGRIDISDKIADYPYQKYPAIKLARFAIDKRYQRNGFGSKLMKEFFLHAWRFVQNGGGRFITVDAKNSAIDFYQTFGFKVVEGKEDEIIVPM